MVFHARLQRWKVETGEIISDFDVDDNLVKGQGRLKAFSNACAQHSARGRCASSPVTCLTWATFKTLPEQNIFYNVRKIKP